MNFTRENLSAVSVRRIEPGAIGIGDETITENVVIFRDRISRGIALDDVTDLKPAALDGLLRESPEIVILGTGWQARQPSRELVFALARRGIGFESMDTPAACRTFNILLSEGRDVAAILVVQD